jgi:hypothetical protein
MAHGNPRPPRQFSSRLALVALGMTLVFLILGVLFTILAFVSLDDWLFGTANASSEASAKVAAICLFTAMASNATAFIASLWGWWHGRRPVLILVVSGVGILASLGCGLSFLP